MDPSRSPRVVHFINNCEDNTKQIVTFFFLCFDLSFIKFLINTREKQELSGVELIYYITYYYLNTILLMHCSAVVNE